MKVIRYSQSFKLQVVQEVEEGNLCAEAVRRKYDIRGSGTVLKWVRRYGRGTHGKITRVETPDEINELQRLRAELRKAKEAIADLHMDLAIEKTYLKVACQRANQTVEEFKKKNAGTPSIKP